MPQPTLEDLSVDQLLAHARQLQGDATMFRQLTANPETRETIQRAIKKVAPGIVIPEIDAKDAVLKVVTDLSGELTSLKNSILERDIRDRLERERARVASKYKLNDSDVLAIEKLMVDKDNPIHSYDTAAIVYNASRQSAEPTPSSFMPPTYSMPEKDIWGPGIGNKAMLNKIGLNQAYEAWGEIMSGKVAGMGPNAPARA